MRSKLMTITVAALIMATGLTAGVSWADKQKEEKPKTIKDVMKRAMKGRKSLANKVAGGKAGDAEKKELLALFKDLAKNKPPIGDAKSWEKLTTALVAAAQEIVEGKDGAENKLKKAKKCGACHAKHKPKKKK